MDDKKQTPKPLKLATGLRARVARLEMPLRTSAEANAQADRVLAAAGQAQPNRQAKLKLAEGLEGRVMRLEMPLRSSEEAYAQADRLYEMSEFRNMTPEEEAKARHMGPEMVERIKEARERRERGIKARRERSQG